VEVGPSPKKLQVGSWEILAGGKEVAILATGKGVQLARVALRLLRRMNPTLVNARFVKPLDSRLLKRLIKSHHAIITVEENALAGGFGSAIGEWLEDNEIGVRLLRIGLPDRFIEHGPQDRLLAECGVSAEGIAQAVRKVWRSR
jgi:1-deoxy-D-xylulose-5-phosphate synthase